MIHFDGFKASVRTIDKSEETPEPDKVSPLCTDSPGSSNPPQSPITPILPFQSPPTTPQSPHTPSRSPNLPFQSPPQHIPSPGPPQKQHGVWCVAKPAVPDPVVQAALDYACGFGADCKSIQQNGSCFQPNTLVSHASYAFNSYWQISKARGGTCDFGGTAMLVTIDPSNPSIEFKFIFLYSSVKLIILSIVGRLPCRF